MTRRRAPRDVRIAIGGRYLDEVRMRSTKVYQPGHVAFLSFPASRHRAQVGKDGITISAQAVTVVQLYAEGVLPKTGGPAVRIEVDGHDLGEWVLAEVASGEQSGVDDIIVLEFRRAGAGDRAG
jgi:hypothetical protein